MTVIDLSGRVAIVTGASRGIGRAAAETLLKEVATVIVNARPSDDTTASFAELEKAYPDPEAAVYGLGSVKVASVPVQGTFSVA